MNKVILVTVHIILSFVLTTAAVFTLNYISDYINDSILGYGGWISIGWLVSVIVTSVVLWIALGKIRTKANIGKFIKSLILLAHVTTVLFHMFLAAVGSMFSATEHIYNSPDDCKGNNNTPIEKHIKCNGYGIFGFQSNYDYEIYAYGKANYSVCRLFEGADFSQSYLTPDISIKNDKNALGLNSKHNHECEISSPETSWHIVKCPTLSNNGINNCYHCARGLSNGNGHRFQVIGFSENCKKAMDISLADYGERLIKKIRKIYPAIKENKKQETPYLDAIKNSNNVE